MLARSRPALLPVLLAICALATAPASAVSHLRLTASAPEAGAELAESPAEIRLWFSQKPELAISRIGVTGPDGEVALGEVTEGEDDAIHAAVESPLAPGEYQVSWRTSSGDGHPIRGSFAFSVALTTR